MSGELSRASAISAALEEKRALLLPISADLGPHGRALALLSLARAADVVAAEHDDLLVGVFLGHELPEEHRAAGAVMGVVLGHGARP